MQTQVLTQQIQGHPSPLKFTEFVCGLFKDEQKTLHNCMDICEHLENCKECTDALGESFRKGKVVLPEHLHKHN